MEFKWDTMELDCSLNLLSNFNKQNNNFKASYINEAFFMKKILIFFIVICCNNIVNGQNGIIVFQTDFGFKDGAVSAMKGVALNIDRSLKLYDLTHEIPAYNIWEAAFRLDQTISYWPIGTTFVSVVDPGVGTNRKSVVVKTRSGHFIVTPDNGTLTLIESSLGIDSIRNIDESINRRQNSASSYTFHGRDVYAFTAAKLAAHVIRFDEVGPVQNSKIITIPYQKAVIENQTLKGNISILDVQYGNLWSNIDFTTWEKFKALPHNKNILEVQFYYKAKMIRETSMPFEDTFGSVSVGKPLAYLNSLMQLSFALNQADMSKSYQLSSGPDWTIKVKWAN